MKVKTKFILGGLYVIFLILVSIGILSLFQNEYFYSVAVLLWATAFLGGLHFKSWMAWAKEMNAIKKMVKHTKKL